MPTEIEAQRAPSSAHASRALSPLPDQVPRNAAQPISLLPAPSEVGKPLAGRRFRISKQFSAGGIFGIGVLSTLLGLGYVVKDPLTMSLLPLGCSFVALVGVSVAIFERRRFRLRDEIAKAFWAQECPEWYVKEALAQAREEGCEEHMRDRLSKTPGPWKGLAVSNALQLARKDLRAERQSTTEEIASC